MRILVTGGAGYVGSHTAWALRGAGHEAVILDDLSTGHRRLAEATGAPLVVGRVEDGALVRRTIAEHGCEALMHFAARAIVPDSVRDPALYLAANVAGSVLLFEAAFHAGVRRVVFSSTAAVYGEPRALPIAEDSPLSPTNPYGHSKRMVEEALAVLEGAGLRWCALRYFNACGAAGDCAIGELHSPETHLIPRLLDAAAAGLDADVYGSDWPTPDGTCVRDYVHVDDLADAHVRALDALGGGSVGAVNLGTGAGSSVLEVLEAVREATGRPLRARMLARRPGDPAVLVASNERARRILGWRPARDLRTVVGSAWRWHQRQP